MKPGVLVLNFGGPTGPHELEPFLRALFDDVLPFPRWVKRLVVGRIAKRRARVVEANYRQIGWSPLVSETRAQAQALVQELGKDAPPIALGMCYSPPSIRDGAKQLLSQGCDALIALSLYPHFSVATSGAAYEQLHHTLTGLGQGDLPVHHTPAFYDHPLYIQALADTITQGVANLGGKGPVHLLFSPHGLPVSFVHKGDPYPDHVRSSVRAVVQHLNWTDPVHIGWQSKVGRSRWLIPSTEQVVHRLGKQGIARLLVVPLAFVGEHIETLHEIDIELAEQAHQLGITHVGRAKALGLHPKFIAILAGLVRGALADFERRSCARCLLPEPEHYARHARCPNCKFVWPAYLTERSNRTT